MYKCFLSVGATDLSNTNPFQKMMCIFWHGVNHRELFLWAEETSCGEEEILATGQGQKDNA